MQHPGTTEQYLGEQIEKWARAQLISQLVGAR